jgi:hypothetical protein
VGRIIGGVSLMVVALVMFYGFIRSSASLSAPATIGALLLAVGLPAAGGVALLAGRFGGRRRIEARRDELRQRTIDAEILRLAGEHGGKLTTVEVVRELALTPEAAQSALDGMHQRELAEIEISESGVIVYAFSDIQHLGEKSNARGLLDA